MTFFRDFWGQINLLDPPAFYLAWGLLILTFVLGLVAALRRKRIRTFLALLAALIVDACVAFALLIWPNPYPGEIPPHLFLAAFPVLFLATGTVIISKRRLLLAGLLVLSLPGAALVVNLNYRQYSTLASILPATNVKKMSYDQFRHQKTAPQINRRPIGALVTVPLTGTSSGFQARDALAYVPPAYWSQPKRQLPVMVLLAGSPGKPSAWFDSGKANDVADDYQRRHNGRAPLVISVDATGSLWGQPGCVDGPKLKIQSYLAKDVPELIKQRFRVNPNQKKWTIGGLSYGGTCALQIIANSPSSYGTFLDFSGEPHPTVKDLETTVKELFNGDIKAFHQVNAADVLRRAATDKSRQYRGVTGKFICGQRDAPARRAQNMLAPLARRAGMKVNATTIPGGHNYDVWRKALRQTFDYAAARGGLT
ncbi:alpha/beta hydrolase [Mobiluncus mulieris]|uniref:alpha/beta hydrolase n=1 Tax=Mobiluncus mulieris TaxID=2052 RepID=UPI00019F9502|nr:alpha/beta hydrolase-fold protein [Mobiluncus mulieris]EEJ53352.1 hypothetical protein HMPREF0577_1615 [Mobiluncus mulieris ATCC 35243]MCU9970811.1 esterase [Mobiluncus mulieris]NMW62678.1 esterase [Mobiluncus mulieris]NMW90260.1 esterase [Mobiluncus mulieris]SPX70766.1 Endo-1,4-beta-xylanase Z precursor [Mobiluncus mulieris]